MGDTTEIFINDYFGDHAQVSREVAARRLEALIAAARIEELENLRTINKFGFERLDTVVEYQDGTSADIPYRHHWNDCYDKFLVTVDDRIALLGGKSGGSEGKNSND
jgi:hypothetical protein